MKKAIDWRNIFANQISDKVVVCRMVKDFENSTALKKKRNI